MITHKVILYCIFLKKVLNKNFVSEIVIEVARVNTELRFLTTLSRRKVFYLNSPWPSEVVRILIPVFYRLRSFVQSHPITFHSRRLHRRRRLLFRPVLPKTTPPRTWKTSTNVWWIRISMSGISCDKEGENLDIKPRLRQHRQVQQSRQV